MSKGKVNVCVEMPDAPFGHHLDKHHLDKLNFILYAALKVVAKSSPGLISVLISVSFLLSCLLFTHPSIAQSNQNLIAILFWESVG